MNVVTFVRQSCNEVHERILASCQGLTEEDLRWRVFPHANSICFILWHMGRAEDRFSSSIMGHVEDLWESHRWYERFGHPLDQAKAWAGAVPDELPFPSLEVLLGYLEAAHRQTLSCLSILRPEELDRVLDASQPHRTVGTLLRHLIVHQSNHHGQLDYIRGLRYPEWGLPPGTGIRQE